MRVFTKTERYLYAHDYNNRHMAIRCGEKVAIKLQNHHISGIIHEVGSKYLYIQTGAEIRYNPGRYSSGAYSYTPLCKIAIADIQNIAKYPKGFQGYGIKYTRK